MPNKVSLYCYLFDQPPDRILCYDLFREDVALYKLKRTTLDSNYKNPTDRISVTTYNTLSECITDITRKLLKLEIRHGIYKKADPLCDVAMQGQKLTDQITHLIETKHIRSFSIFGQIKKYNPRTPAIAFLRSMGYFILFTLPPHVFVLDDFVDKEHCITMVQ